MNIWKDKLTINKWPSDCEEGKYKWMKMIFDGKWTWLRDIWIQINA